MTGGGRGLCNPVNVNRGAQFATGFGRGSGAGRRLMRGGPGMRRSFGGRGFGWNQPVFFGYNGEDAAGEIEMLKNQADYAKNSLDAIHKRMAELEKKSE
jgi:hypothetical protein